MSEELKKELDAAPLALEEKKELQAMMKGDIETSEGGLLIGKTFDGQWRLANMMLRSGMLPKHYDKPEKVMAGMQFATSLGFHPLLALRQIAVINGQPSLWGDLPLSLVRRSGKLVFIDEFLINSRYERICLDNKNLNDPIFASVCRVQRVGEEVKENHFTVEDAKKMGKYGKDVYLAHDKVMFKRKARNPILKDVFGDVLEGVPIAEYDWNTIPEAGGSYELNHDGGPSQEQRTTKFEEKLKNAKPDIETSATPSGDDVVVDAPPWDEEIK